MGAIPGTLSKYATGKGSAAGRKYLAPPYYRQRAVFGSLLELFGRDAKHRATATLLAGWRLSVTAGIVSKRLNLS